MFKSIAIPWKGLVILVVLSSLLAACAPIAQSPTTGSSELATPASETGAEQVPTIEVGQAPLQPTESVAQAPTAEAATGVATEMPTVEAPTTEATTEAPGAGVTTEVPTTESTVTATATPEATVASSAVVTSTTPEATVASSTTLTTTAGATPVSTPSTLPVTGASDDSAAGLSLILLVLGAMLLAGALGVAFARRER